MMSENGELIRLEIAMDYAVNWKFDRILRDLIQNFYDSIGWERFHQDFIMETKPISASRYELIMETHGRSFSYEWLTWIGGSTKTESGGSYIGMYGEGFKICALCLKRDGKTIEMESADWFVSVGSYEEKIGEQTVPMLGYYLRKRMDDGSTRLRVCGLDPYEESCVAEGKLHFFYPENPLFGPEIVTGENYAVYERSDMVIPCRERLYTNGILYCNRLARGRLPLDLIIQLRYDMTKYDHRDRRTFNGWESTILLNERAHVFSPLHSRILLERMEKYWNDMPSRLVDVETWYYVICQLVRNIASDPSETEIFCQKYKNLVYIDRKNSDPVHNRRVEEVTAWVSGNSRYQNCRFVNPVFRLLGAKSVMNDYEALEEQPQQPMSNKERALCEILLTAFEYTFPYKIYEERPEILIGDGTHYNPMQYCERDYSRGRRGRRYRIHKVLLDRSCFDEDRFSDAFLELSRCLLHVYGTDRSAGINAALTDLGAGIIDHEKEWNLLAAMWRKESGRVVDD